MNVNEASALYHVSKAAIYQHLRKASDGGKDKDGEITEEGLAVLASVYASNSSKNQANFDASLNLDEATINPMKAKIDQLTQELASTLEQLSSLRAEHNRTLQQNDELRSKVEALTQEVTTMKQAASEADAALKAAEAKATANEKAAEIAHAQYAELNRHYDDAVRVSERITALLPAAKEEQQPDIGKAVQDAVQAAMAAQKEEMDKAIKAAMADQPKRKHWWQR